MGNRLGSDPGGTQLLAAQNDRAIVSPEEYWNSFANSKLGIAGLNTSSDWDDYFRWNGDPWLDFIGGTGSQAQLNPTVDENSGVFVLSSGAGANSFRRQFGGKVVSNTKTKKWFIAVRFRIPTAMDAQAKCGFGITDANAATNAYVIGSRAGDANFGVYHGADFESGAPSQLSFGVAFDNNFHIAYMYCLGDNVLRASLDFATEVSVTPAATVPSPELLRTAANGTTAAARTLQLDYHSYFGERG